MSVAKHKMPQYYSFILDGKSNVSGLAAHDLYETMFEPSSKDLKDLVKVASKLTENEIQALITKAEKLKVHWVNEYLELRNRIFPNNFNKGVRTKEDYDALADDDKLKVILEKIALIYNGNFYKNKAEFYAVDNVRDLEKFRKTAKTLAVHDFKYAFGKSNNIIDYLADNFGLKEAGEIEKLLKDKYGIELSEEDSAEIGTKFGLPDDWDGSIKSAIEIMMKDLGAEVDSVVKHPEANKDVKDYLRNFLETNLYFNEKDIKNASIKPLINFIDRIYDPENDEELIQKYRQIQDMTKEEFKKEILSKVTLKDLGIKSLTGFDILKKIKMYEENATTAFKNMIINSSLKNEINIQEDNLKYAYTKFDRIPILTPKNKSRYDFGQLYTNILNNLLILSNEKFFNVYKEANQKEGFYTAFSKFDYVSNDRVKSAFDPTTTFIETNIATITGIKNQIESYRINEKLQKYANKFSQDTIPSDYQFKNINLLAGKLVSSSNVPSLAQKAAEEIVELPRGTSWSEYSPLVQTINTVISEVENTSPGNLLAGEVARLVQEISYNQKALSEIFVQKRYQNDFNLTMKKYEQALIKQEYEKALELKGQLLEDFKEHHILKNPQNLLEAFLKSHATDSRTKDFKGYFESFMKLALSYAQLGEIEEIIQNALEEGVELSVKDSLKAYTFTKKDGTKATLDSPEMVADMANQMIIDQKLDTPLLFLEKFGFNDIYVEYMVKSLDLDSAKKKIDINYNLVKNFGNFEKIASARIDETLKKLENNEEHVSTLNILKKRLKSIAKYYKLTQKEINILISAIDNTIEFCNEDEKLQPSLVFNSLISDAKAKLATLIKTKYEKNESFLSSVEVLMNLITSVMLMEGSEADIARKELCDKYQKLAEYREQLNANLPES